MEDLVKRVLEEIKKIQSDTTLTFPVEASARHVHLSQADVEALFGKGYSLTPASELSQPGQFLAKERVSLIGPKGSFENVAVLGPARSDSQVEISLTDARTLGIKAPIRESGKVDNTPGLVVVSEGRAINLERGVIAAKRHIHMSPENARAFNVNDKDIVSVQIHSERPLVFQDVLIRVSEGFNLSMHVDLDEANACGLDKNTVGEIL